MAFITSTECLHQALCRLCDADDAVLFRNKHGIMLMIRATSEGDTMNFDISIVTEKEPEHITTCVSHEPDAIETENREFFLMDEFSCKRDDMVTMDTIKTMLNDMWGWSVCPCAMHFVKDGSKMCYVCHMSMAPEPETEEFCAICHEHGHHRWMMKTSCCSQNMHKVCRGIWANTSSTCAYCRST